ncbi:MAG TPA: hypothetical protein VFL80_09520, partial [Thermoanaerobaculia bacterium]|nr:hypothetical protein [Thermoanaerobaculia bacterium]
QEEVSKVVRVIRSMRDDIQHAERFEELSERNLLRNTRTFKHRIGDLYFQPDVLLAIIEMNVATRNRFVRLYQEEEHRILDDADKLMAHGDALARNFGSASPQLAQEISRFRDFKRRFDDARAGSNIKYGVVTGLKSSIGNILAQLDRGLEPSQGRSAPTPDLELTSSARLEALADRFGSDEVLLEYLRRIAEAIDSVDPKSGSERMIHESPLRDLRLERWEVTSYWKLFGARSRESEEDEESLWMLYLRSAALRVKADEEATLLATTLAAGIAAENDLLERAKKTLDWAKALDATFTTRLQASYRNQEIVRHLYRSRFRLLRTFSGLWLIYDRQV